MNLKETVNNVIDNYKHKKYLKIFMRMKPYSLPLIW